MFKRIIRAGAIAALAVVFFAGMRLRAAGQWATPPPAASSIPTAQLMQPEGLNQILHGTGKEKPLVLQVGSRMMFAESHIAGAEYAGPGSQEAGLELLKNRVSGLRRNAFLVIYCGCCPWNRCPNMGPAWKLLHAMGFTRVKALYLADNFGTDWEAKGYAVANGQ